MEKEEKKREKGGWGERKEKEGGRTVVTDVFLTGVPRVRKLCTKRAAVRSLGRRRGRGATDCGSPTRGEAQGSRGRTVGYGTSGRARDSRAPVIVRGRDRLHGSGGCRQWWLRLPCARLGVGILRRIPRMRIATAGTWRVGRAS